MKIEQNYSGPTVYVQNASRTVGVVAALLSDTQRDDFVARTRKEYETVRIQHGRKKPRTPPVTLEAARDNDFAFDWQAYTPPVAHRLGVQEVEASIETLRNYIDWTPFFMTWSLAGKYPRILEDEVVGVEAQRLFKDANDMLDKLSAEKTLNPRGVVGLFPANRVGDDIEIYRDETRTHVINVSHHLRQQTEKTGFANYCLADFVAPKLSGKADYIDALRKRFPKIVGPRKDDICYATTNRQEAVRALAEQAEVVLVVGSKNSSNSNRLAELAQRMGKRAFLIDDAKDIQEEWVKEVKCVGVTAGASAPDILVQNVVARLQQLGGGEAIPLEGREENIVFEVPKELRVDIREVD